MPNRVASSQDHGRPLTGPPPSPRPERSHDPQAVCPAHAQCGGCPLLGVAPEAQLEHKLDRLRVTLGRYGVTALGTVTPRILSAEPRFAYRNRVRLQVGRSGTISFFNAHKSAECAVLGRGLRALVDRVKRWSTGVRGELAACSHLEARAPDLDGQSAVCFTLSQTAKRGPQRLGERVCELGDDVLTQVVRGGCDEPGPSQRFHIHRDVYQYVPLGGFMQVNSAANAVLVDELTAGAVARSARSFVDAYCGSGNLSLPLLAAGLWGEGVERSAPSVRAASRAAREQGFDEVQFHAGDVQEQAARWLAGAARYDLVVIDPPRAGARDALRPLADLARQHVALCSCNSSTLARDLADLAQAGFALEQLCLIDMFPHTEHVEALAWMGRR
jgi:23S rRNA (uracil1939-C5)-methyltransferase